MTDKNDPPTDTRVDSDTVNRKFDEGALTGRTAKRYATVRKIIVALFALLAVTATGYAVEPLVTSDTAGASATGDTVCQTATATTPGYTQAAHTIADNGTGVYTIPGKEQADVTATAQACVTVPAPATTTTTSTTTTSTTTTSPAPPAGKTSIRGPILFRYGNSYGAVQTAVGQSYDRYGIVVVGYGDDWKVVQLPTAKGFAYRLMAEAHPCANDQDCLSGISQQTADRIGCSLKNAGNNFLAKGTYHLFDVGSVACQQQWIDNVAARLTLKHLDGLFIDNLICDFADELSDNGPSAKYPTKAAQRTAVISFAQNVSSQLQAKGFYVLTNTLCYGDSSAASNTAWWNDVASYPNGLITETFEQNPSSASTYTDLKYDCPTCSWMGDWKARLDVIDAAQNAVSDAWELSSGGNLTVAKYACASFLLRWNGKGGGCGADTGGADPYDAAGWTFPIGTPTGTMTQSGGAYYRTFTGGRVIVNPSLSTQTVLGVTLPAKSAYIGV